MVEEPLVFGPAPRPAGDVDPDVIESIIFGPPPRPHGYVDPDFVEPIIFGPQPRPDNYLEPEDLDNLLSMEDDTTHGGFHVESPVRPDDAPTPTADAAGRAEDPVLLTSLSEKLDRCMGRIDSLETELGTTKKIMGGAILTLVSRVKKLEKTVKQLRTTRLVGDVPASEGDVDIQDDVDLDGLSRMASAALGPDQTAVPSENVEEREEEEVPLRRKRSAYRRARTEFSTPAFEQFQAHLSAGPSVAHTAVPEPAGPSVAADKGKVPNADLDYLQNWLHLMMQVGSDPALARKLLGADVNEENFIERMNAVKERKKRALANLRRLEKDHLLSAQYNLFRPKPAITKPPSKRQRVVSNVVLEGGVLLTLLSPLVQATMDSAGSRRKIGVSPFADSVAGASPFLSSIAGGPFNRPTMGKSISGDGVVFVDKLPDDEIVDPRVKVETVSESVSSPPRSRRKHLGVRSDDFLWDKPVEDFFSSESESDDDMENYIPPLHMVNLKIGRLLTFPPHCRILVFAGNIIQTGLEACIKQAYECIASAPICCSLMFLPHLILLYQRDFKRSFDAAFFGCCFYVVILPADYVPKLDHVSFLLEQTIESA
ncbi:hypothetical protein Tco_0398247 [Tanacetum coccineum]